MSVNYGSSERFTDRTALNCLMDNFDNLDDFILSEAMSFADAFAYRMNQNNCKTLEATGSSPPTLSWTDDRWDGFTGEVKKMWSETMREKVKTVATCFEDCFAVVFGVK